MTSSQRRQSIPAKLSVLEFERFVLPHLSYGTRAPVAKLTPHAVFNYILQFLYRGRQWKQLPIEKDAQGKPEIHYTRIYSAFRRWQANGCIDAIFTGSVLTLKQTGPLDTSVLHGDGATTAAKKGGDNIGCSGHKKMKGGQVVIVCDRNCNVIVPLVPAPGNHNESPMFREALPPLKAIAKAVGLCLRRAIISLDGAYDCRINRKAIFNRGMTPHINPNPRGGKTPKRGPKPMFDPAIFKERFNTIERVLGWEDKFKRLLQRFERISERHYSLKTIAYTMINLRHFCQP